MWLVWFGVCSCHATRAQFHVTKVKCSGIAICTASIPGSYCERYTDLRSRAIHKAHSIKRARDINEDNINSRQKFAVTSQNQSSITSSVAGSIMTQSRTGNSLGLALFGNNNCELGEFVVKFESR